MKNLLFYLSLLSISGCQGLSQKTQLPQVSTGCTEKPQVVLTKENITKITLENQIINKSGQASATQSVGYTFAAQAGQKLSYRTQDDICIWTYTPDNQLLDSGEIPQSGNYILQVSAPRGSTTFNLKMSLGTLEAPKSAENSSSALETSDSPSTTEILDFSQEEAIELIQNWYDAKPQIFAPPFDQSLVEKYATGKLYEDKTKPGGSIDWLRSHDSYYTYENSKINKVVSFFKSGKRPAIILNVSETLYLHEPKGINGKNSGSYNSDFMYSFEKNNGIWKIYDYNKISK